jgi:hypothetical protein
LGECFEAGTNISLLSNLQNVTHLEEKSNKREPT